MTTKVRLTIGQIATEVEPQRKAQHKSWVIRNKEGKYMYQDIYDRIRWIDTPATFGGERHMVEMYYSPQLAQGCTLEEVV